jgi:hypothetical protein
MSAVLKVVPDAAPLEVVTFPDVPWCELTKVGLRLSQPNLRVSYDEWESLKPKLTVMEKGHQFSIGDWMTVGEAQHGEKAAQAIDAHDKTGINVKSLMEYRRVSQKVPYSIRIESLDWAHHQVVAAQPKPERKKWLQIAAENDWKVVDLRNAIREAAAPAINVEAADNPADYLDPHYKSFLLDYIATQYSFLNRCNYEPFKAEIERTIRHARYQSSRTPAGDRKAVRDQVDEGCCTVEDIGEEIPLAPAEIKRFFIELVGSKPCLKKPGTSYYSEKPPIGDYEWRPIGQHTEMARGGRAFGIYRIDAPSGDDFSLPRSNAYEPMIEYDDE